MKLKMVISAALPLEAHALPVVPGFNYEAHDAPAYQISTKSGDAWPSCCDRTNFPGQFFRKKADLYYHFLTSGWTEQYQIWAGV